jgi:hypothetical protein
LRHYAFVRGNYQQDEIDAAGTSEHVFDEPLVTGDVDETYPNIAQLKLGEADIYGYSAFFFFG